MQGTKVVPDVIYSSILGNVNATLGFLEITYGLVHVIKQFHQILNVLLAI